MLTFRILNGMARRLLAERAGERAVERHGLLASCRALRVLNFYAKERDGAAWKASIYQAKSELIRLIYEEHGARVVHERRTRRCFGPVDALSGRRAGCPGDGCRICRGRGVFHFSNVYLFVVEIAGEHFFWHHRVDDLAGWNAEAEESIEAFIPSARWEYQKPSRWEVEVMYATICAQLRRQGRPVPVREHIGLLHAAGADLTKLRLRVKHAMRFS